MPDDRVTGRQTDDLWPSTDGSSTSDPWPPPPESPVSDDSWASDLSAATSDPSNDIWAPPSAGSDPDTSTSEPWDSDSWASTNEALTDTRTPDAESPVAEIPDGPWVDDVWASTEPAPWVSDLWASTGPSTATDTDSLAAEESSGYLDTRPPTVDVPLPDESPVATPTISMSEPFWRSESWLLEPGSDDTQSVEVTGDAAAAPAQAWSGGSTTDSQPIVWDSASVGTDVSPDDEQAEPLTHEPLAWGDLGDDSESTWSSYQRELDGPVSGAVRPAEHPTTVEPSTNASQFAFQRSAEPPDPPTKGFPKFVYKASSGQIRMKLTKEEQSTRDYISDIRRRIAGLRQITFTNPKGGSGKTTAALLTSMTLGQLRGGYVLAWDNNETQGTLGVRARRDDHANTVRDLIADLPSFSGPVAGRVGDLAKYVRSQGDAMFDILASDEQAEAGEMMTAAAFQAVREVVGRFYKIICVDTGNNVRAANWAASIDSTDQLVVTASVRWESAYSASRMLDYLEQSGRGDLVSNAVTVLTMPASMKGLNVSQVETHFGVRTREVLRVPFDARLDNGDEIPYAKLNPATRSAWLQIGAAITRGL